MRLEHTLSVLLPPKPLVLKGDFARVAQILANLINNAAKYTDKGGRISLTAAREGAEVVFRVRDTGMGIPPDLLIHIFEPFTQIDAHAGSLARRTGHRPHAGPATGGNARRAGLWIQRGPEPGQRIYVSSAGRRLGAAGASEPVKEAIGSGNLTLDLRVLIVDDNRDVAESTAALLRLEGCDVHLAHDGEEALRVVIDCIRRRSCSTSVCRR